MYQLGEGEVLVTEAGTVVEMAPEQQAPVEEVIHMTRARMRQLAEGGMAEDGTASVSKPGSRPVTPYSDLSEISK